MVIETKEDVVRLSGSLHKNQWMSIKAAANLLLQEHPEGIIVDCSHLNDISDVGAKTFLEAMRDIESAHSRIIVAHLPENILTVCRSIPGVRSQLPIADTVESARASLRSAAKNASRASSAQNEGRRGSVLLVPLIEGLDLSYGVQLATRIAVPNRTEIHLVYLMEVARDLALHTPRPEQEQSANAVLEQAKTQATVNHVVVHEHLERVRDAFDGILNAAKTHHAETIVVGITEEPGQEEKAELLTRLMEMLLKRAPCEVLFGRPKPQN